MTPPLSPVVDPQPVAPARPSARLVLGGLVAGLLLGAAAFTWPGDGWKALLQVVEPASTIWLAAVRMLILPLMVSIVLLTLGSIGTAQSGRYAVRALAWYAGMVAVTVVLAFAAGALVLQAFPLDEASREAFRAAAGSTATGPAPAPLTTRDRLVALMPSNLMAAAANGDLLAILIATLCFGAALRYLPARSRALIVDLSQAVSDWCLALAGLLFRLLPLAAFGLMFVSTARSGRGMATGLLYWVVLCSGFVLAFILALIPVSAGLARMPVGRFARAIWPAQLFALSTRSSAASLPAMVDVARHRLRIPDAVADVTLPLAISSFKISMAISPPLTMLFLLQVYGLPAPLFPLLLSAGLVCLKSFASPGLPSASYWSLASVFLALGIPVEGVLLVMAVDAIPDLFKTVANVTAPLSITAIVARRAGESVSAASAPGSTPAAASTA